MNLDIDVSGGDLLSKNYTICIANKDSIIKGFKINEEFIKVIISGYKQGKYKYPLSKKGKSSLKVRIYCVIIFYLIKSLNLKKEISLNICRDFTGRENDIRKNLKHFLEKELNLDLKDRIYFERLTKDSNAHKYSFLMRHDTKNQMKN